MIFAPVEPLVPGARVAVVAPAGPFDAPSFERGLALLEARFEVLVEPHVRDTHRYLAGRDEHRLVDLQHAFDDASLRAVFTARGGYGSARLLPKLRLSRAVPLIGFSDITSLHCAMQTRGQRSLHAPVLTQLGKSPNDVVDRLFAILSGATPPPLEAARVIVPGRAEGPLLGGNLSVLTRLIGTPWWPSLRGAVLLLEDVGERPYRIDRMLTHLKLSGLLEGVVGLALGEFTDCDDATYPLTEVLDELVRDLGLPCVAGLRIGHGDVNQAAPLGARVRLDADAGRLEWLEGLCS